MKYRNVRAYLMGPFNSHRNPMFRFRIEQDSFTHSFGIDIRAMLRVSSLTIACLLVRRDERERTNGYVRFPPCHSKSTSIVRARVTCLSSEFIRSLALLNAANAHLLRINSLADTRLLLSCLRSAPCHANANTSV